MGLAAFVFFVIPWMLVAIWIVRSPGGFGSGAPAVPWRALTDFSPPRRDQRHDGEPDGVPSGAASDTADDKHRPFQTA